MKYIEDWEFKRLTDLAEYINGYAFKPDDWSNEGLPIIRIEQLKNPKSVTDYYSGRLPERNIIDDGDLIFSWSASLFLRIWKYGMAALNQHLFKVVEKDDINKIMLKYFIEYYLPEITKASHGSTMQHITRKELERFGALYPIKKDEQSKIAEVLETVDSAIEKTEELIAKQERIKTGLMQDLLTKGIDENGDIRSEETHEFKDSPVGRIPLGWESVSLKYFIKSLDAGVSVNSEDKPHGSGQIGILKTSALSKGKFYPNENKTVIYEEQNRVKTPVKGQSILISRMNTPELVGESCFVDKDYNDLYLPDRIWISRFHSDRVLSVKWLSYVLISTCAKNYISLNATGTSGSMKNISKTVLLDMPLYVPVDVNEQERIAKVLNNANGLIEELFLELNKLKKIKRGLMQDLLSGKKRVTSLLNDLEVIS